MFAMKTSEAVAAFGSVRGVADALHISVQAVYAWGGDVPQLRAYQLRDALSTRDINALTSDADAPSERRGAA